MRGLLEQATVMLKSRGWVPYRMESTEDLDTVVARGPAPALEVGQTYLVLPAIPQPTNPVLMQKTLNAMEKEEYPVLMCNGQPTLIAYFTAREHGVDIHETEVVLPYEELIRNLCSLVSRKTDA